MVDEAQQPPGDGASTDSALVEVERRAGVWRDRVRTYRVFMDDTRVGAVAEGATWTCPVTPGRHRLYLRLDWCRSPALEFEVVAGEVARFVCEPGGGPWRTLYDATVGRRRYISLLRGT